MQDNELYEGILGLESSWRVVNVVLDTSGREVLPTDQDQGRARAVEEIHRDGR